MTERSIIIVVAMLALLTAQAAQAQGSTPPSGDTVGGIPANCLTMDGAGHCINGEPPPPRGVPVGVTSDRAPGSYAPAQVQAGSNGQLVPLAPSEMTPDEFATYQSLANDLAAQMSFRDTRAYLRLRILFEAGTLAAKDLPAQPDDYNRNDVSQLKDQVVTKAMADSLADLAIPIR